MIQLRQRLHVLLELMNEIGVLRKAEGKYFSAAGRSSDSS